MKRILLLGFMIFLLSLHRELLAENWALWFQPWRLSPVYSISVLPEEAFLVGGGQSVLKLDKEGNFLWRWDYQWISNSTDIQPTFDGGAIAIGHTGYNRLTDIKLVKVSATGLLEWNVVLEAFEWLHGTSIHQVSDGGYILAGYTRTEIPFRDYDFLLIRLAQKGTVEWVRRWDRSEHDEPLCVEVTRDGGCIIAGRTGYRYVKRRDVWIMKLDATGSVEWQNIYGGEGREEAHSIQQTQDGGYIVAGWESSFAGPDGALMLKLDPTGLIEWQYSYKSPDRPLHAACVSEDLDGGYVLTGGGWEKDSEPWFMKLSIQGDPMWGTRFTSRQGAGVWITPVPSGGYAAVAWREGEDWINDRWITFGKPLILRMDNEGSIDACGFVQDLPVSVFETTIQPQPTQAHSRPINISVSEEAVTQTVAIAEREVLCGGEGIYDLYPPLPVSGQRQENRSFLFHEYLDEIIWEANPRNQENDIRAYRIYLDSGKTWTRIAEVGAGTLRYLHHNVERDYEYTYFIVSVDSEGRVSYPDLITIR